MTKLRTLICMLSLCLFVIPMASAQQAPYVNPAYSAEEMSTINGKKMTFGEPGSMAGEVENGFAFTIPDSWKNIADKLQYYFDDATVTYFYLPRQFEADYARLETMENEEGMKLYEKLTQEMVALISVIRVNPETPMDQKLQDLYQNEYYEKFELLAESGDNKYYVCYTPDMTHKTLDDAEKAELKGLILDAAAHIKENLMLFPAQDYYDYYGVDEQSVDVVFDDSFSVKDLDGKDFTTKDFEKYDLTVINIWSTTCGPCVEEMPLLAQLHEQLPQNVNFITVCLDAAEETDFAKQVLEHAKAKFQTLVGDDIATTVMKNIEATPTTIFVDAKGQPAGSAVIGAPANSDEFVSKYLEIIQQRLDDMK